MLLTLLLAPARLPCSYVDEVNLLDDGLVLS